MSLLVDGNISAINDLTEYESSLTDVAVTEGIDLLAKLSVAKLEIGLALQKFLLENLNGNQSASLIYVPNLGFTLNNVVVTDGLKQWHVLQTIAAAYRDAFNQQLNDRYKGKWKEYADLAVEASTVYFALGVGLCFQPMPKPQAPALGQVTGRSQAMTWFVQTSWINSRNQESAGGVIGSLATQEGSSVTARISTPPPGAVGWNVYVGTSPDTLYRQNKAVIPVDQLWTMTDPFQTNGLWPGSGQSEETVLRKRNVFRRG